MRKLIISMVVTMILLAITASSVLAGGVIKVGADVGGEVKFTAKMEGMSTINESEDIETGFSVGGEFLFDLNDRIEVGAGAEYQLKRNIKDAEEGAFNFIPIYALGRYQINPMLYLTGKIGYNLFQQEIPDSDVNVKGGLYYGFGAGVVLGDLLQLEVLYSIHNGKWEFKEDPGVDYDISWKYTKIGISAGFKF